MGGEGPCTNCGGGEIHTLYAACHDTSDRCKHLGPDLRDDAIAWVTECRVADAGLPTAVVNSFFPSEACLCRCHSHRYCVPPATVDGAHGSLGAPPSFRSVVANKSPLMFVENKYTRVLCAYSLQNYHRDTLVCTRRRHTCLFSSSTSTRLLADACLRNPPLHCNVAF